MPLLSVRGHDLITKNAIENGITNGRSIESIGNTNARLKNSITSSGITNGSYCRNDRPDS